MGGNGPGQYSVVAARVKTRAPNRKATVLAQGCPDMPGKGYGEQGHDFTAITRRHPQRTARIGIVAGALPDKKRKAITGLPL